MKVKEVEHKKWLKGFFSLLRRIYKDDRNFVHPLIIERKEFLDPKRNPFFNHAKYEFILAEENGEILGTIIPFIDRKFNEYHNEKTCHFGFFECINDKDVAKELFHRVSAFAWGNGMEIIRGPFNFSTNHECGLLVDGFDSHPVVLMTYNPPYYIDIITSLGYTKAKDLLAFRIDAKPVPEALLQVCENIKRETGAQTRKMKRKDFSIFVNLAMEIYNDAWSENWGFVPMDRGEFIFVARGLKLLLDEDLCFFVTKENVPVGFSITLPDYNVPLKEMKGRLLPFGLIKFILNKGKIKNARLFAFGIKKEFHDKGFGALLYLETWKSLLQKGYKWAEMSWILEDNHRMIRAIEMAGGSVYKTYRIFEKKVNF